MNVLFDATWLAKYLNSSNMHGGLRVTYELAKRLVNSKELEVFFTTTELNYDFEKKIKKIVTTQFNGDSNKVISNNSILYNSYKVYNDLFNKRSGISYIRKSHSFLREKQLNTFNIYHTPADPIPEKIKKNKQIKHFLTALDLIALVKPEMAYQGFNEQLYNIYNSINSETTVLAISQSTKNDLLNYRKDIKEENVIVTYIAADKYIFFQNLNDINTDNVLKKYGLIKNNYFFSLSALARFKNTKHVVNCFLKYIQQYSNKEVKLLLVGKTREVNYDIDIFQQYKNHPQIVFLNYLPEEELSIIYSNAICFLYMSLYEGFGLPILEAMQCGTPVICSNTSSMPEVIGNAGISIDPTDEDLLCDSIRLIYDREDKREYFKEKGLERAKLFSWEKYTSDVIKAYQSVL